MPTKKYNPTSPARRFMTVSTFEEITKSEPERSLLESLNKAGGRNNYGRITVRHRGGGNRRKYRSSTLREIKLVQQPLLVLSTILTDQQTLL